MLKLSHSIKFYVPSTTNCPGYTPCSQPMSQIKHESYVYMVERAFCQMFGGCTTYSAFGSWVNDSGSVIREPVTIVQSFFTEVSKSDKQVIGSLLLSLFVDTKQEAISLEVDNRLFILNDSASLVGVFA